MKSIGGYSSLELPSVSKGELYPSAIKLNTGRACLEYILRNRKYQKIYLPYYTCQVVLDTIQKVGIDYDFYHLNQSLEIDIPVTINQNEVLLYTNYFGVKNDYVMELSKTCSNLIIDNSQAFYSKPLKGVDTFYTCRKFFGVADGAYLFTTLDLKLDIPQDFSSQRMLFLLDRIDKTPEEAFEDFHSNESLLDKGQMYRMSKITQAILASIDYQAVADKRCRNFERLHQKLKSMNELPLLLAKEDVPMVYPFLAHGNDVLRKKLIANRIYVAKYWPNVERWAGMNAYDTYLANNLLPLPIDQRYGDSDIDYILETINLKLI